MSDIRLGAPACWQIVATSSGRIFPSFVALDTSWLVPLHARVAEEATRRGFEVIDLRGAYVGPWRQGVVLSRDGIHPTRTGKAIEGRALLDWFTRSAPWAASRDTGPT